MNLLAAHDGEAKPLAGGQSLMPMMPFRVALPRLLVDPIPGLTDIRISEDGIRLGAMVRWRDIHEADRLVKANPSLVAAVGHAWALSDPQPRHCRGQPRSRRSGRRNAHNWRLLSASERRRPAILPYWRLRRTAVTS
jgi:hypothetical protein